MSQNDPYLALPHRGSCHAACGPGPRSQSALFSVLPPHTASTPHPGPPQVPRPRTFSSLLSPPTQPFSFLPSLCWVGARVQRGSQGRKDTKKAVGSVLPSAWVPQAPPRRGQRALHGERGRAVLVGAKPESGGVGMVSYLQGRRVRTGGGGQTETTAPPLGPCIVSRGRGASWLSRSVGQETKSGAQPGCPPDPVSGETRTSGRGRSHSARVAPSPAWRPPAKPPSLEQRPLGPA